MQIQSKLAWMAVCAIYAIAATVAAASPITSTWLGGAGNWVDAARWSAGIPGAGYQVLVDGGNPASSVVTVNVATPALNNIGLDAGDAIVVQNSLSSGEITSFGGVTVNGGGTLNVGASGFVQDQATAALTVQTGGSLLDAGAYSQGNGSTLVNGTLSTPLFHVTGGTVTTGNGGFLNIGAGGYTQAGSTVTTIDAGGSMTSTGFVAQGGGDTIVNGTLSSALFHVTGNSVQIGSGGILDAGAGGYTQGTAGSFTSIAAGGELLVGGGDYSQEIGTWTVLDGALTADTISNSGDFSGIGTMTGSLIDLGSITPGDDGLGSMTLDGQYDQTGFLYIDISGPNQANRLAITGAATLGGTLSLDLLNGFTPSLGDAYEVLSFGSRTGDFGVFSAPALPPGLAWQETYDANDLYVSVVKTSVPEPGSILLLLAGLGLCALRKRVR